MHTRTPIQYVNTERLDRGGVAEEVTQAVELELPTAMRVAKHKNTRYIVLSRAIDLH